MTSSEGAPPVAVVVLNWNGRDLTSRCLESLRALTFPGLRVVVVDNGSTGGDAAALRAAHPWAEVLETGENLGFAGGCNVGIRHALAGGAAYVLLLNNDTVAEPGLVEALVEVAESRPRAGVVSPKVVSLHDPEVIQYAGGEVDLLRGRALQRGEGERDRGQHDGVRETGFCVGAAALVRGELLRDVGLLNEGYFLYQEDAELCLRARDAGYRLYYTGAARVLHAESASTGGHLNPLSLFYSVRNGFHLVRDHGAPRHRAAFTAYNLLVYPLLTLGYALVKGKRGLWRAHLQALAAALRGETGPTERV